jgi:hypothetical protein
VFEGTASNNFVITVTKDSFATGADWNLSTAERNRRGEWAWDSTNINPLYWNSQVENGNENSKRIDYEAVQRPVFKVQTGEKRRHGNRSSEVEYAEEKMGINCIVETVYSFCRTLSCLLFFRQQCTLVAIYTNTPSYCNKVYWLSRGPRRHLFAYAL